MPRIPGVEKAKMSFDVFGHEEIVGKKVVIIGGGAIGVELGIHLNGLGRECTVVEMGEFIAAKAQLTERTAYLNAIRDYKVETMVNARCTEITDKGAQVETPEGTKFLDADTVIIAVGTKSLEAERDRFTRHRLRRHQRRRLHLRFQHRACRAFRLRCGPDAVTLPCPAQGERIFKFIFQKRI